MMVGLEKKNLNIVKKITTKVEANEHRKGKGGRNIEKMKNR
jgi:hypothetical protein